jgi:hypothetical protein
MMSLESIEQKIGFEYFNLNQDIDINRETNTSIDNLKQPDTNKVVFINKPQPNTNKIITI